MSGPAGASFRKGDRLLKPPEFVRVRRRGGRFFTANFTVYVLPNGLGRTRLGVTVSSRVGGAVKRNRIKRLVREFFRRFKGRIPPENSVDIVISARKGASPGGLSDVEGELAGPIMKAVSKETRRIKDV